MFRKTQKEKQLNFYTSVTQHLENRLPGLGYGEPHRFLLKF